MSARLKTIQEQRGAKVKLLDAIFALARKESRTLNADEGTKFDALEKEIEVLNADIDREVRAIAITSQNPVRLSEREDRDLKTFDYRKLLGHMVRAHNGQASRLEGIEAEMIQEGETEARAADIQATGLVLPRLMVRRGSREMRDMTASGTTSVTGDQGGMTIATMKQGLLDDFFNASVLQAAGATVLEGLQGNLDIPRILAGTAGAGKAENANSDEVTPTTAMLSLSPKRLPAYIDISQRLMLQSSSAIESILRNHLTTQMGAVREAAFFHGTGTNEANGIAGTSGIGSVAGGTNGLAPAWTHFTQLEEKVDAQNALLGNLHYFSNGQIRKKLKETQKVSGTDSKMILDDSGRLNGYDPVFTNAISRALTKGSSSGVASAIFFGNAADYYAAYWSGVQLELIRDKPNAISGLFTLVASCYYDGGVVRPKSFAAMLDALGA